MIHLHQYKEGNEFGLEIFKDELNLLDVQDQKQLVKDLQV